MEEQERKASQDAGSATEPGAQQPAATTGQQAPVPPAPAKKAAAKKAQATKAPAKKVPAKKAPAAKSPAKKSATTGGTTAQKAPAHQARAQEAAAKDTPAKKAAATPATKPQRATSGRKRAAARRTASAVGDAAGAAAGRAATAVESARSAGRPPSDPAMVAPRRLSGFDFATWRSASDDPTMRSPIIGLIALDTSPDWAMLVDRFDRASRIAPVLRQKILEGPADILSPRLVIDPDFDLSFHMRRFRIAEPGSWEQVLDEARRQSMTNFDLARPLWQVTLMDGLVGGRAALLVKLHHAIADGQGAMMLGATVIDLVPQAQDMGPMPPAPVAAPLDSAGFLGTAVVDASSFLVKQVKDVADSALPVATRVLRDPVGTAEDVLGVLKSVTKFVALPTAPLSPVMRGRSINYHFMTFDIPMSELKAVSKPNGVTLNDAFMAGVTGGLRIYHDGRGGPVKSLRCNMPISLRDPDRPAQNAVTIARFEVPVDILDPVERMRAINRIVDSWRREPALHLVDPLAEVGYRLMPSDVVTAAARTSDFTASNVPGVPMPVFIAGARVRAMYPLTATIGAATNVTLLSYAGNAGIGISMDDAAIADRDFFVECMIEGFTEVVGRPVAMTNPLVDA